MIDDPTDIDPSTKEPVIMVSLSKSREYVTIKHYEDVYQIPVLRNKIDIIQLDGAVTKILVNEMQREKIRKDLLTS